MSIFAYFFASQLLLEMGWPRKLGRFKGQGYDVVIVDAAFERAMEWAAGLGAGRPRLALQMITEAHQGDWEDGAPDIEGLVRGLSTEEPWLSATSPQEALLGSGFADAGMTALSVDQFLRKETMAAMEPRLFHSLLWGLSYPDRFEAWYESHKADYESRAPEAISHGLEIDDTMPPLQEFYGDGEQILRDYEREVGPLPSIPPRLLADAEALGWRV